MNPAGNLGSSTTDIQLSVQASNKPSSTRSRRVFLLLLSQDEITDDKNKLDRDKRLRKNENSNSL